MTVRGRRARIRSATRPSSLLTGGMLALVMGLLTVTTAPVPAAEKGKSSPPREKVRRLPPRVESPGAGRWSETSGATTSVPISSAAPFVSGAGGSWKS